MTFEELDQRFPNAFDDAEIMNLTVDYRNRVVRVELSLRGNLPESRNGNEYQQAVLVLSGFYYLVMEAPDADHLWYPHRSIQVNGYSEDAAQFPLFGYLKQKLPSHAFCCRLYVHDWNSFIRIAAPDARFSFVENAGIENLRQTVNR